MRRLVVLVLILTIVASGCVSLVRQDGPTVETHHGLVAVSTAESDPPLEPHDLPVLQATVQPAPLLESDGYEECQEIINKPIWGGLCAADWSRTIVTPGVKENISLVLTGGPDVTRFRVFFMGHRPDEMFDVIAVSREYVAPSFWSGELSFEVPIAAPFVRVLYAHLERRSENGWVPIAQTMVFAPCPDDFPWPEDETERQVCEANAR